MSVKLRLEDEHTELFAPREGEFYNYAPCMVQTDDSTKYVFYCTNKDSSVIVDYIGWRKGTFVNGKWEWSSEQYALAPGDSGWDHVHVCDPDVLKGEFHYQDHTYTWALFYLGCDRLDCNHNQIGVAFADQIEGPWVKFEGNPVVSGALEYWGTGQCSEVSIDNKGRFKLIYRDRDATGDHYKVADCDFSDMSNYTVGTPVTLTKNGMPTSRLSMSHVAYDSDRDLYYMCSEKDWDGKVRCCQELVVSAMDAASFDSGGNQWETQLIINQSITGKYGNHNPAFGRDPYGKIWSRDMLDIAFSSGEQSYIWSFRICELFAEIRDK